MKALSRHSSHVCGADASHQQKQSSVVLCWHACDFLVAPLSVCKSILWPCHWQRLPWASLQHLPQISSWFRLGFALPGKAGHLLDPVCGFLQNGLRLYHFKHQSVLKNTLYFKGLSLAALLIAIIFDSLICARYCTLQATESCYFYFMREETETERFILLPRTHSTEIEKSGSKAYSLNSKAFCLSQLLS